MQGMSRHTGVLLDPEAHLAQSVVDILSTAKGTRVMRRDYGSDLPLLVDRPINGETLIDLYQATAEALDRWEPRITVRRVAVEAASAGALTLMLSVDTAEGEAEIRAALGAAA